MQPEDRKPKKPRGRVKATQEEIAAALGVEDSPKMGSGLKPLIMPLLISAIVCFGMLNFTGMAVSKKDFETNILNIAGTIAEIQAQLPNYALKTALNAYAPKTSLNAYALKSDLGNFATKADLAAAKPDMSGYVTKAIYDKAVARIKALETKVESLTSPTTGATTTGQVQATIVGGTLQYVYTGPLGVYNQPFTVRITNSSSTYQWVSFSLILQSPTPAATDTFVAGGYVVALNCSSHLATWTPTYTGASPGTTQILFTPLTKGLVSAGEHIDLVCFITQTGATVETWHATMFPVASTIGP